jgi:hypothetical protein
MNSEFKQFIAIIIGMALFSIGALSLITLNPFGILIGVFGIHWLFRNLDKFV